MPRVWSWGGPRTVLDNGCRGGVKPLALHDLVAEGSGIKDKRRVRNPSWQELSQSHSRSPHSSQLTSDFGQQVISLELKGMRSRRHRATAVMHSVLVSLHSTSALSEALQGSMSDLWPSCQSLSAAVYISTSCTVRRTVSQSGACRPMMALGTFWSSFNAAHFYLSSFLQKNHYLYSFVILIVTFGYIHRTTYIYHFMHSSTFH